jgi:polysaccharide transporter, PST family
MDSIWLRYLPVSVRSTLHGRPNLQKLLSNTGWLFADKIVRMGVGLVVGVWIARFLGVEQFGLLSYALAFVALFNVLATLGLDGTIVQELVRDPAHKDEILGTAFMLKLVGGALSILVAVPAILTLKPGDPLTHRLVAIIAVGALFQSFDTIDFWFQSQVESRFVVFARSIAFLLISALKILLIVTNAPLVAFAFAFTVEILFGALGLIFVYSATGHKLIAWRVNVQRITRTAEQVWPIAIGGVALMVYMKIDQVMLGQMLGNKAVGVYSAAVRISEIWYFIPMSIVATITPSLIEAKKVSEVLYYDRLTRLFRLMCALAFAIAVPFTFASGYVAKVLYGNAYEGVGPTLTIHIWAGLFVFLGVAQSPWSINEGLTKLALVRTVIGAVANVVLNLWLIPEYGPVGAAVATTVSYALSAVILNAFSSRTRAIFALQVKSMLLLAPSSKPTNA